MRSIVCTLVLACSVATSAAQTVTTTLVDVPKPYLETSQASTDFHDYIGSHPLNLHSLDIKLAQLPTRNTKPFSEEIFLPAALPNTLLWSFNGIATKLDACGISYNSRQTGSKLNGKGIRFDPKRLYTKIFRRRIK